MNVNILVIIIILLSIELCVVGTVELSQAQPCQTKTLDNGRILCVCNSTYCDFMPPTSKVSSPNYIVITSNEAGLRFSKSEGQFKPVNNIIIPNAIKIGDRRYQKINGFGGAFTDAVGFNIKSLSSETQQNLLRSYFGEDGIEYSMGRVPIGCTDFGMRLYSYDDVENDTELEHFNLVPEDYEYKIPIIQEAQRLSKENLWLIGSAWTSPKWMKVIEEYVTIFGELKKHMYQPWADYHVKFLEAYEKHNVTFWGITTGNEPSMGYMIINMPTVAFTARLLSQWIANNLGPAIRGSKYSDIKIITLDDEKTFLPWFIDEMFINEATMNFVDGIGLHWYFDAIAPPYVDDIVHEKYNKFLIETESCRGQIPSEIDVDLGSWQRGEEIASGVIRALAHWSTGWIDWNMALNEVGGPSATGNYVDSPIIVNATADEFYKQPMFYALGHFSKFIPRGSIRFNLFPESYSNIQTIGFIRPDGGIECLYDPFYVILAHVILSLCVIAVNALKKELGKSYQSNKERTLNPRYRIRQQMIETKGLILYVKCLEDYR